MISTAQAYALAEVYARTGGGVYRDNGNRFSVVVDADRARRWVRAAHAVDTTLILKNLCLLQYIVHKGPIEVRSR